MKKLHSWATIALLAAVTIGSVGAPVNGAAPPAAAPLSNGVYAVLRQGLTRAEVQAEKQPHLLLVYDRKHYEADKDQPPRYVALDASPFVPLVLAGTPDTRRDDRGWTLLNVTLAPQHVKTLEHFTRDHLGGVVAVVIDGEIVTTHKVRTVIEDGKVQVTRCFDEACRTLLLKLAK
jgi:hypothetical protein